MLFKKLIKGGLWNSASQGGVAIFQFVFTIVLARLLSPAEFGLLGMVTVFTGFFSYFSEFGFQASIVQKKEVDELDLNTAFWSTICLSVTIYLIVFFAAPLIALFYKEPKLVLLCRIIFIGILIKPFGLVQHAIDVKVVRYDRISKALLVSVLLSGICALICAALWKNVWCLVVQFITREIFEVAAYFVLIKWKPQANFSFVRLKALFSFGLHVTLNNLIKFFSENIDSLLIGKILGSSFLGVYTFGVRMSRYAIEKIWLVFGRMLFPAFSTIQDDSAKLQKANLAISLTGGILLFPFICIGFFGCKEIILLLVGTKWIDAVIIVKIMMFYIAFYAISLADEPVIFALGKIYYINTLKVISALLLLGLGFICTKKFGLVGMGWTFSIVTLFYYVSIKIICYRLIGSLSWETVKNFGLLFMYLVVLVGIGRIVSLSKFLLSSSVLFLGVLAMVELVCAVILSLIMFPQYAQLAKNTLLPQKLK